MLNNATPVILSQEFFFDMNKTFVSFNVKNSGNKLPKYQQLVNSLLQDIEMGELKPGERLPSINEASEECYLSRDTVERAYTELHKMGAITSIFRKGYFISESSLKVKTKVLFLIGRMTETNQTLYNAFLDHFGKNVMVDIYTYQYKPREFKEIIGQQLGNYHYYLIQPHLIDEDEETVKILQKIAGDRLILLDQNFGTIRHSSLICPPNPSLKKIFNTQLNLFNKYRSLNLVLSEDEYFDPELINACSEFCESNSLNFQVLDGLEEDDYRQNEVYFTLSDTDLFQAIKYAEKKKWTLGKDVGIISLNDHPFKEIIAGGITVVSTHPEKLGQKAAEMILNNKKTAEVIEPSLLIRLSL